MNLTNEEIRIKVAESMGWRDLKTTWEGYHEWMHPDGRVRYGTKTCKVACLPNYPESLDACAEFRKTLTDTEKERYVWWLNHLHPSADIHYSELQKDVRREVFDLIDVKPIEHCVAYLKMKELIP